MFSKPDFSEYPSIIFGVKGQNKGRPFREKEKILENTRFSRINDGARGGT